MDQQRAIECMLDVAVDQARRDQRGGICIADTQRLAMCIDDDANFPGLERGQRRTLHIDLVREHPQMPGAQSRVFVALQVQGRIGHFVRHGNSEGMSSTDGTACARRYAIAIAVLNPSCVLALAQGGLGPQLFSRRRQENGKAHPTSGCASAGGKVFPARPPLVR
jgi:hypothetical protein